MSCLVVNRQTLIPLLQWIAPGCPRGGGRGGAVYKHGQAGAGAHLLLHTGGRDLNYLLADETNHKQVSERERRCHNATLQLLTDSHTDQISLWATDMPADSRPAQCISQNNMGDRLQEIPRDICQDWLEKEVSGQPGPVMIPDLSDDTELLKHNTCFCFLTRQAVRVWARHKNAENIS